MKKSILLFLLLIWFVNDNLYCCTVFMGTNDSYTLVGSNEDYKWSNSQIFFIPSKEGKYGYALFGYDGSIQAGINEKGLFWDGLRAYPYVTIDNNKDKPNIDGNVLYKILEECATVEEVIKLFETFHWDGFRLSQLMVVDKTGESAIITYSKNGLVVTSKEKHYQVCANFRISCKEDMENFRWYNIGCGRFKKAEKRLQNQELTVNNCFSILKATRQNNLFAKTIYSTVFNLNTGDIHLSVNGDFSQITKINLQEELKKGRYSYFLSDLINTTNENRKEIEIHDEKYLTINNDKLLLDKDWNLTVLKCKAKYYRTTVNDSVSAHYVMRDYFMNDTLQGVAYYSSLNPEIIDGNYYEYHENGNVKVAGHFKHRLKHGEWKYWSNDGKLEQTIKYVNGIKQ
ncbi:MAG: linear amide C-N hydrolase [Marinilabiliaceae bacterium]|nr:linear amide C-N hydrolase [Marinilabiliaceae bacterium]